MIIEENKKFKKYFPLEKVPKAVKIILQNIFIKEIILILEKEKYFKSHNCYNSLLNDRINNLHKKVVHQLVAWKLFLDGDGKKLLKYFYLICQSYILIFKIKFP